MSTKVIFVCIFTFLFLIACGPHIQDGQISRYAFTYVTVINPADPHPADDMTVVIEGNRIVSIGKSGSIAIPKETRVVDASGKFLIPGLWDFHIHSIQMGWPVQNDDWFKENTELSKKIFLPLLVANGITSIRDMGGNLETYNKWRKEIESGSIIGPRITFPGEYLISPNHPYGFDPFKDLLVTDAIEGRQAVNQLKNNGADFIKIISLPSEEVLFAVADEAAKHGLPIVGHADYIPASLASDSGYKCIEHIGGLMADCAEMETDFSSYFDNRYLLDNFNEAKASALFERLISNETWVCPTLAIYDCLFYNFYELDLNDTRLKYIPAYWKNVSWMPYIQGMLKDKTAEDRSRDRETFEKHLEFVAKMHAAGIKILAGTDGGSPFNFPGFSLHKELLLLTRAGLTPLEALKAATILPAEFLGMQDSLGSIEIGKTADLVLLDANPLDDISNTQRIASVVLNGRILTREDLDKMLAEVEAFAKLKRPAILK
jgi:imidazolonepropionase-like amidohydrolase